MDVFNALCLQRCRRSAANTFADGDADASGFALKRPEHQFAVDHPVESGPVEAGHMFPDKGGDIGHVGDSVRLTGRDRVDRRNQITIQVGLGALGDIECVHLSSFILPRPFLTSLRMDLPVRRRSLAARVGLVLTRRRGA